MVLSGDGTVIFFGNNRFGEEEKSRYHHLCPLFVLKDTLQRWEMLVLPAFTVGGQDFGEPYFISLRGVAVTPLSCPKLLAFGIHTSLNSWSIGI